MILVSMLTVVIQQEATRRTVAAHEKCIECGLQLVPLRARLVEGLPEVQGTAAVDAFTRPHVEMYE